jgi:hypothetical protein
MNNAPDLVHATGCKQPTLRFIQNVENLSQYQKMYSVKVK